LVTSDLIGHELKMNQNSFKHTEDSADASREDYHYVLCATDLLQNITLLTWHGPKAEFFKQNLEYTIKRIRILTMINEQE